jgi:hypothetical protein
MAVGTEKHTKPISISAKDRKCLTLNVEHM